jgi:hypothetical protein
MLATLVACSADPLSSVEDGLAIFPSVSVAQPGDSISIRFLNWGARNLQGNLCPILLQHQQGSTWVTVASEPLPGSACTDLLRRFRHGYAEERRLRLPAGLAEGEYRVTFQSIALEGGPPIPEDLRASSPFRVQMYIVR